jgi:hypothetical protein
MILTFDLISPLIINDAAYFLFSVGASLLFVASKGSTRITTSLQLPEPVMSGELVHAKTFQDTVKAAMDSCIIISVILSYFMSSCNILSFSFCNPSV